MKTIFIDGKAGTTGLRIFERLESRDDVKILTLSEELRKDPAARKQMLNTADIVFLCLPDAAAREAVAMIDNPDTVVIDTSTAHRTNPAWIYGFPEIDPAIAAALPAAKRIAVPGCHASGFIALVKPLIDAGVLSQDTALTCHSVTGYSGGGKAMIAQYETAPDELLGAPRQYGLAQTHKHLPEMTALCHLTTAPIFCPIVADFYSGMEVTVPLFAAQLQHGATVETVKKIYKEQYTGKFVHFVDDGDEQGFLSAAKYSNLDSMQIGVFGNDERLLLTARYDNLGKGASGAAIQILNILLGAKDDTGLYI